MAIVLSLREQIAIANALRRFATFPANAERITPRAFVAVVKPVSKRAAKSAGSKTRTLKVRNWRINAAHFN